MMQLWCRKLLALPLAGALVLFAGSVGCGTSVDVTAKASAAPAANTAEAEGWGTIKGQVVWAGKDVPKQKKIDLGQNQDKAECLKNGPLIDDRLVVNSKNKGVRWAGVYLMSADGFKKAIPIHPSLKEIKKKVVEVDQPCCLFEPHMLAVRQGQTLVFKNSAKIPHNVKIDPEPSINQLLPPGGQIKLEDLKARALPLSIACNIHGWMSGKVFVLSHPYFAVTDEDGNFEIKDAPAGNFRLVVWHEEIGWVAGDGKPSRNGKKITIKAGETTDLGKFPLKPAE